MHLLKWQYQPDRQSKSWLATIDHQRDEIEALLLNSPSLRTALQDGLAMIYPKAFRDACRGNGAARDDGSPNLLLRTRRDSGHRFFLQTR